MQSRDCLIMMQKGNSAKYMTTEMVSSSLGGVIQCHFGCNIDESGGVFEWPTKVGEILCAIWVDQVFEWLTKIGEIMVAILMIWVGQFSGPLKWVVFCMQYWWIGCGIYYNG